MNDAMTPAWDEYTELAASTVLPDVQKLSFLEMLSKYRFRVPDYQRQYAWTQQQIDELISDIVAIRSGKGRGRFLGYITVSEGANDGGDPELLLIDGQQRITTMTLILMNAFISDGLVNWDVEADQVIAADPENLGGYRFLPSQLPVQADRAAVVNAYKRMVSAVFSQTKPKFGRSSKVTREASALINAFQVVGAAMKKADISGCELLAKLRDVSVVLHVVKDDASGAEIFDGVNNRGLQLSEIEKLKASILYYYDRFLTDNDIPEKVRITNAVFKEVYELLKDHGIKRDSELLLVDALLPACADIGEAEQLVRDVKKKGVSGFRSVVDAMPGQAAVAFVDEYVRRLPYLARFYCELVGAQEDSYPNQGALQKSMIQLSQGMTFVRRSAVSAPVVVSARFHSELAPRELIHLLRFLERAAVHAVILSQRRINKGAKDLRKVAIDFALTPVSVRALVDELSTVLAEFVFTGAEFKSALEKMDLHHGRGMCAYVHANWLASLGFQVSMSDLKKLNEEYRLPYLVKPKKQPVYGNRKQADTDLAEYADHPINFWPVYRDARGIEPLRELTIEERFAVMHDHARSIEPSMFRLTASSRVEKRMEDILKKFTKFAANRWELDEPSALWNTEKYPLNYRVEFDEQESEDDSFS